MIKNYIGIAILSIIVLIAVIYGFTSSGSPINVRKQKFDTLRTQTLSDMKYSIENHYRTYGVLPATMDEAFKSYYGGSRKLEDPETKKPYEYRVVSGNSFQLCATFSIKSDEIKNQTAYYNQYGAEFDHPQGYHCFDFTVTPTPTPYDYNSIPNTAPARPLPAI